MFNHKTAEGEGDSKKKRTGQLSSSGPGLYWFWQLINIGAEVRTTRSTCVCVCVCVCVWMGWTITTLLRPVLGRKKIPPSHVASKRPTAFIWLKALTTKKELTCSYYEIQAGEMFNWALAEKAILFHSCCTVAVEIHRLLSICHFFSHFLYHRT